MGAGNVAAVFARWAGLPDGPFRALTFMANTALDTDAQPRYWAGRELLANAMGYIDLPTQPTATRRLSDPSGCSSDDKARERAFQAVKRALRDLTTAGAITRVTGGVNGHNSVYQLHLLDSRPAAVQRRTRKLPAAGCQGRQTPLPGVDTVVPRGSSDDPLGDTGRPPARGSLDDPLRGSLDAPPGGHLMTLEGDTGRPPKEKGGERGTEEEEEPGEASPHLTLAAPTAQPDVDSKVNDAVADLARLDQRCPHGVRGGLTRNPADRIRCPACRRATAVPA